MNQHRDEPTKGKKSRYRFAAGLAAVAIASGGLGLFVALGGDEDSSLVSFFHRPGQHDGFGGGFGGDGGGGQFNRDDFLGAGFGPGAREYRDHGDPADHQGGDGEFSPEEREELEEEDAFGPWPEDFVDITTVGPNVNEPQAGPEGSDGTFTVNCGPTGLTNNENVIVNPGTFNAAQHTHEYFGNSRINEFTPNEEENQQILLGGDTTCENGDQSMHYWPVMRDITQEGADANEPGGGLDGNVGQILDPVNVTIEYRGNPQSQVTDMPLFIEIFTGNARAFTTGEENSTVQFTCTGFEDTTRLDDKYPLCPEGSNVVRMFDFPSCWDGVNIDSEDNRGHIFFPEGDGNCPEGTLAVPQLRHIVEFDVPDGPNFAIDSFPEERHDPITDHSDHKNVMPEEVMSQAVECINSGQNC